MEEVLQRPYRKHNLMRRLVPQKQVVVSYLGLFAEVICRYGASGVWIGTRFVASEESGAPRIHKEMVVTAGYDDTVRTLIYSGRPLSVRKTPYVADWCVAPASAVML